MRLDDDDPNDQNLDGEDLGSEDLGGENLDDENLDGEDLDGEDLGGEHLDDEDPDGKDLDFERNVEALREIIEESERDEGTGEVIVWARTLYGMEVPERVRTLEDMKELLLEFGWGTDLSDKRWGPQPARGVFGLCGKIRVSHREVDKALEQSDIGSLFQSNVILPGVALYRIESGIVLPAVRVEIAAVSEALIRYLAEYPQSLYLLEPRRFEELVAELFRDSGYEVLLTPRSRDGGIDIRAVWKGSIGTVLYLVDCKRYRPSRPVGVGIVRGLYGVTQAEQASCGVLATTSRFTADAREFARRFQYRLSLRDYSDIVRWLKQYPFRRKR